MKRFESIPKESSCHPPAKETLQDLAYSASNLKLLSIMDSSDAMTIQDTHGNICAWSHGAEIMYGYNRADALAMNIRRIIPADKQEQEIKLLNALTDQSASLETQRLTKDGRIIDIWLVAAHLIDHEGQGSGIVTIEREIPNSEQLKRRQAEEELKRYKHIISSSPDMVALLDTHYVYLSANEAYSNKFGLDIEQIQGKTPMELFGEDYFEMHVKPHAENCMAGQISKYQAWFHYPVAGRRFMDISYFPYYAGSTETINGYVVIARDITKQMQLENQIRQSQKMEALGTLSSGIAHEFNNVLFVILANVEISKKELALDEKTKANLENISKAGERAMNLVKKIMTFSRVEVANLKPTKISDVIIEALDIVRATIPVDIELRQHIINDCYSIRADSSQLHQLILNFCINAYQAMGESGGLLEVSLTNISGKKNHSHTALPDFILESQKPHLHLRFRDSGCGIPIENQDKIFDPFFTTKEVGKGTGLGLAVIHSIIENHHGQIMLQSEPGLGTTFDIFFPAIEVKATPAAMNTKETKLKKGKGHILVAEDETSLLKLYNDFLHNQGYEVTICTNGADALEAFESSPEKFDLVFTDQAMPKMSGKFLSQAILKLNPNIPIILATGYSEVISAADAKAIGIRNYLSKPIKLSKLNQCIIECLTR